MANFPPLKLFQEIIVALFGGLGMEDLLHDLLNHLILFLNECLLAQELGPQLLILMLHTIKLLLEGYFLLIQSLLVGVLQRVWNIGPLIQILFGLAICEVCNALESL